ncbi:DNA helicase [Microbacterium halophytorum]|uniref:DNA helicase n=1 Tax=Microbacterium halophytorum TaxID=2067568 RepID=UPI000CFC7DF5|nr:DNA helicase [Microbacterium halophytorum]
MSLSPSKKQKKELRKLQKSAAELWDKQQVVAGEAAALARVAGTQAKRFGREQLVPAAHEKYDAYLSPYVERARPYADRGYAASKRAVENRVVPAVGSIVGRAAGAWDAARQAAGRQVVEPPKKKRKAGPVLAVILGIGAAVGIAFVAWQTLRADDELWVADDPLSAPDA